MLNKKVSEIVWLLIYVNHAHSKIVALLEKVGFLNPGFKAFVKLNSHQNMHCNLDPASETYLKHTICR